MSEAPPVADASVALRRGRPPASDRARIARSALDLFARQGFEVTTLEEVAAAAGTSTEAVLRCYDSTSAIVWEGEAKALRAMIGELDAVPTGVPWRSALVEVLLAAQHHPDAERDLQRSRLQVVHSVPLLRAHQHARADPAVAALSAFIARRTGEDPDGVGVFSLARAVWAASQAALEWWSTAGRGDPAAAVRAGLSAIGFSSP